MSELTPEKTSINQKHVTVIEDFIDEESAKELLEQILEKKIPDRRANYEFLGLGNLLNLDSPAADIKDPENIIKNTAVYAHRFFKNLYDLDDTFVLDRIFANIMNPGASLSKHMDFSYGETDEHDFRKKTFACGLFLTDDYEGGEFSFFETSNVSFKPKTGTLVLFTGHSTWHAVNEVLSGSRVNLIYMFYYTDPSEE